MFVYELSGCGFESSCSHIKKDGSLCMILTLKKNEFHIWSNSHDKKPTVWIAIADLKDAIYSVKIHPDHEKYSKFYWNKLIQYPNMPNRHENINKILKVNFATSQKNSQCLLIIEISKEIH